MSLNMGCFISSWPELVLWKDGELVHGSMADLSLEGLEFYSIRMILKPTYVIVRSTYTRRE